MLIGLLNTKLRLSSASEREQSIGAALSFVFTVSFGVIEIPRLQAKLKFVMQANAGIQVRFCISS